MRTEHDGLQKAQNIEVSAGEEQQKMGEGQGEDIDLLDQFGIRVGEMQHFAVLVNKIISEFPFSWVEFAWKEMPPRPSQYFFFSSVVGIEAQVLWP